MDRVCYNVNVRDIVSRDHNKVVFTNLDLDFKLIDLKCLDFKSIDFKSYFKSKHFKGFKSFVDLSNRNP